ncbi:MAG TPA: DNA gyrase inhibitor YacG [Geomonas sp.]|nr:DNA gyrase inhibitor YacG [Geomonas sp.]
MSAIQSIKCPQCKKEAPLAGNPYRPFCSKRCKMIDLGTWANEGYRIPGEKAPEQEEEEEE